MKLNTKNTRGTGLVVYLFLLACIFSVSFDLWMVHDTKSRIRDQQGDIRSGQAEAVVAEVNSLPSKVEVLESTFKGQKEPWQAGDRTGTLTANTTLPIMDDGIFVGTTEIPVGGKVKVLKEENGKVLISLPPSSSQSWVKSDRIKLSPEPHQ